MRISGCFGVSAILQWIGLEITTKNLDKLVDASLNVSSIFIGLLGALLGIVLSIRDAELVQHVMGSDYKSVLFGYIWEAISAGFCTIIFAAVLYVVMGESAPALWWWRIVLGLWSGMAIFMLLSAFLSVRELMTIISNAHLKVARPDSEEMQEDEAEALRNELSNEM
ncbi:hypothetical protein [Alicyclobacillus dauci]|uniref:Uncharacterized protein n=1 Tax=Alicyclobacillus dauci TaxID=1475485 RepID=A0ABY6Z965_9BACL|nr:hypothetical protein [Alicyclobacillus dauci]WAH38630.1 hypothetical protein NZD86_09170 [Alicyclobacillus dauci]